MAFYLPMKITVQSSKAVKPGYGDGGGAPSVPTDIITLTVLDTVNFDQCISNLYFIRPPAAAPPSSNAVLEQGLAKALAAHRQWAVRFDVDADGGRAILLNDAGSSSWRPRPTSRSATWCRWCRRLSCCAYTPTATAPRS
jgi:shikimate O-hydroxycinnamoyltransferase